MPAGEDVAMQAPACTGPEDEEEDAVMKVALYLSQQSQAGDPELSQLCLTLPQQDGSAAGAYLFDENLAVDAFVACGDDREVGTAVVDGNCMPDSVRQLVQRSWDDEMREGCKANLFTKTGVRASVTSFVRDAQNSLPLANEVDQALGHLAQDSHRATWADKFVQDREFTYECFLLAFGVLTGRNVGIWINSSPDVKKPVPLLVKFDFAAGGAGGERDEVAFVNHNHWIPIYRK